MSSTASPQFRVRETAEFRIPGPATDGTVLEAVEAAKEWARRNPPRGDIVREMDISIGPDRDSHAGDLILSVELRDERFPHRPRIDASTVRDGDARHGRDDGGPLTAPGLMPGEQVGRPATRGAVHPTGDLAGPTTARDV